MNEHHSSWTVPSLKFFWEARQKELVLAVDCCPAFYGDGCPSLWGHCCSFLELVTRPSLGVGPPQMVPNLGHDFTHPGVFSTWRVAQLDIAICCAILATSGLLRPLPNDPQTPVSDKVVNVLGIASKRNQWHLGTQKNVTLEQCTIISCELLEHHNGLHVCIRGIQRATVA